VIGYITTIEKNHARKTEKQYYLFHTETDELPTRKKLTHMKT